MSIRLFAQSDFGPDLSDFRLVLGTERGVCQLDGDFLQVAGEFERHLIILADRRTGVFADVQRLIRRDAERNGSLDPALGHLPSVHRQRRGAAFAQAAAVIIEVNQDGVFARGNWSGSATVER
jgi:hypothetical protein